MELLLHFDVSFDTCTGHILNNIFINIYDFTQRLLVFVLYDLCLKTTSGVYTSGRNDLAKISFKKQCE